MEKKAAATNVNLANSIVKSVLVIDDAFAPATIADITEEDMGLFSNALVNHAEYLDELIRLLALEGFDPLRPADINRVAQTQTSLDALWKLATIDRTHWLNETLFANYRNKVQGPREEELGVLRDVLNGLSCQVSTYFDLDFDFIDIAASQIIFFDFFLKGETVRGPALRRAKKLGEAIQLGRLEGRLTTYPLIILMSSRDGAESGVEEFKRLTGLRGDFFRFMRKKEVATKLDADFSGLLRHYVQNQELARLLDQYWISAHRASEALRDSISKIEPTELALLQEAELGVEQEWLPEYLSWLVSEYLASLLVGDESLRSQSAKIPSALAHVAFPGVVAPTSALTDMFIRSTMRTDINDGNADTRALAVTLGDVFARFEFANADPVEFCVVVDQTCDLARPANKIRVLCLVCPSVRLTDIARAFYRSEPEPASDILPIEIGGEQRYYLAVWDFLNPKSIGLGDLAGRKGSWQRVARFKPVRALARQEQLTQKLGRIGEEVVPPHYMAYRAKLILSHKGKGKAEMEKWEFDASNEAWPSVVMVHGRHKSFNLGDAANAIDEDGIGKTEGDDKKASARLSFTDKFTEWLAGKLGERTFPIDVRSRIATLIQKLQANDFQRLEVTDYAPDKRRPKGSSKDFCKTKAKPTLVVAFDSALENVANEENVLCLTLYKTT